MATLSRRITPCLWLDTQAEDAARFYGNAAGAERATKAFLQMKKFDVAALLRAFEGKTAA